MQERLHKIAVRLSWLQPLALIAGGLALVATGYIALDTGVETEQYLVPAILLCCWCLLVFTLINMFRAAPPSLDQTRGFFRRLAVRFHRFLRNIMALCFLGLTGALILLSYKLLTTGVG